MKKNIIIISIIIFILNIKCVYGISSDFKFLIDTVGIPEYNVLGKQISEDIYNKYKVFSYDEPYNLISLSSQNYKTVSNGFYTYKGNKGEFNLLGYNYNGGFIYNYYYPVDFCPETTPDKWNFIYTSGALESWNSSNFKNEESLEYMKSATMLFDEINFKTSTTNPYNLTDYNISASKIGLDKVTLNTASSFITNGIVTARRKSTSGYISYAIFLTEPMAINAKIDSNLSVSDKIYLTSKENTKDININFGAEISGLTNYATEDSIKEVVSELYINDEKVSSISNKYTDYVSKNFTFKVDRETYSIASNYSLNIKVKSYFYTEFDVDGIFKDEFEKNITLVVEDYKEEIVGSYDLNILEKNDQNEYILSSLIESEETKNISVGLIEKGRYVALKIETNKKLSSSDFEIYINESKKDFEILLNKEDVSVIKVYIDDDTPITLSTWNYLRNESGSYFDIDFDSVGNRVLESNIIKFISGDYEYMINFDTIDNFNYNINYTLDESYKNINWISLNEL